MSEATEKFEGIIEMDGRSHDDVHFDEEDDCFTPTAPPTKTEPQAVGELSVPHRWYTDPASDETCCDKCGQPQNDASEFCSVLGRGGIETPKPVEDRTGETMTIAAYTATKYEGYYPPYLNVTKADGADEVAVTVRGCVNHLGEEGEIVRIHIPLDEWTKIADAPNNTRTAEREALPRRPCDWIEDYDSPDDNGQYQHTCETCGTLFFGHKRRGQQCKACWVKWAGDFIVTVRQKEMAERVLEGKDG